MKLATNFIILSIKKISSQWLCIFLILLNIFFIQIICSQKNTTSATKKIIDHLTNSDRKILQTTFNNLIFFSSFGFTLFGDKPVSFEFSSSLENFWAIWEKNKHLFSVKKYILTKFYHDNYCGVLIGNKCAIEKTFENNKESFRKVFDYPITSQTIIEALESGSGKEFEILFSHDALLGILLGYGKENAWNFQKRKLLKTEKNISKNQLHFLNEKLQAFQKPILFWERYIRNSTCLLPQFAADLTSEETKDLKKKYQLQRTLIEERYRQGDSLSVTLQQLCQ